MGEHDEGSKELQVISFIKKITANLAKEIPERSSAMIITKNGLPAFVCVRMDEYDQIEETKALLKLIQLGKRDVAKRQLRPHADARLELDLLVMGNPGEKV